MTFRLAARKRLAITFPDFGKTEQHHEKSCDATNIVKQYLRTGDLQLINRNQGLYVDLPDPLDYQEAMNIQIQGQEAFASLPASVRERFHNDPAELLAAIHDPSAADELRELGILNPKPVAPQPPPASGPGSVPTPGSGPIGPDGK